MDIKKQEERHNELKLMFLEMGKSLVDEGLNNKDYTTASIGNSLIFISSLTSDIEETKFFSEFCNMMATKKMVNGIINGTIDISILRDNKKDKDTLFNELIKKIRKNLDNDEINE